MLNSCTLIMSYIDSTVNGYLALISTKVSFLVFLAGHIKETFPTMPVTVLFLLAVLPAELLSVESFSPVHNYSFF